jgi:hypothetical protein
MASRMGWLSQILQHSIRRRRASARRSGQAQRRSGSSRPDRRVHLFEQYEERVVLNAIPVATDDLSYVTAVNTNLVVTSQNHVMLNDSDPEGNSLTASIVTNPANGLISNFSGSAGTFTYTPNSSYTGVDTFNYKVNDGTSDSDVVTVAIAVGGHFGARTNLSEQAVAFAGGCAANTTPLTFSGSCLTGDLEYSQTLTPGLELLYNSGTVPKPITIIETFLQSTSNVPDEIKAKLTLTTPVRPRITSNTTASAM